MAEIQSAPDFSFLETLFLAQQKNAPTLARSTAADRIEKLRRLEKLLMKYRLEIQEAMRLDFRKSSFETDITETGVTLTEIRHTIRHLRSWMTPRRVATPLPLFGTSSEIRYEPKGCALIISPWNFPFNLTFVPLISAIAAGCAVVVKPSEFTTHASALIKKMLAECFPENEVALLEGGVELTTELLKKPFNHIFFTGNPMVGKIVMRAAAENLASVTLELGGKCPVFVDETANLPDAVSKIAFLKCMNAGQICIEPDYLLLHESRVAEFVDLFQKQMAIFYGSKQLPFQANPDYARIINDRHFNRIKSLVEEAIALGGRIAAGGHFDLADRFIEPTVLVDVPPQAKIWSEEIFGPVLPIRTFREIDEAIDFMNSQEKPLAQYIFSKKRAVIDRMLAETSAGGVTVNDCGLHFYNPALPFGGVNNSGIGKCHSEWGFLAFSNEKAVTRQNRIYSIQKNFMPPYGRLHQLLADALVKWL